MSGASSSRSAGAPASNRSFPGTSATVPGSSEYRMLLPTLPTGKVTENSLFLHCDPAARPYGIQDIAAGLSAVIELKSIASLGGFQFNHVWMITFKTGEDMAPLASKSEITVKGRKCVVIDPNVQEKEIKVHWVPHHVPDVLIAQQLGRFGKVKRVVREKWRIPGLEEAETNTRVVQLAPRDAEALNEVPHQAKIDGVPILIAVPGRPPLCLRCRQLGHIRRQCRATWCRKCRSFGHIDADCVQTYASKTKQRSAPQTMDDFMDAEDIEAAKSTAAAPGAIAAAESKAGGDPKEPVTESATETSPPPTAKPNADEQQSGEEKPAEPEGEEVPAPSDQPGGTDGADADEYPPTKDAAAPRQPATAGVETRRRARGKQGGAAPNHPSQGETGSTNPEGSSTSGRS